MSQKVRDLVNKKCVILLIKSVYGDKFQVRDN